jgi:hypothetical protein
MLRILLIISTGIILILFGLVLFWWPASDTPSIPLLATGDLSSFDRIHRIVIVFPGDEKRGKNFFEQWRSPSMPKRMSYRSLLLYRVVDLRQNHDIVNGSSFPFSSVSVRIWSTFSPKPRAPSVARYLSAETDSSRSRSMVRDSFLPHGCTN